MKSRSLELDKQPAFCLKKKRKRKQKKHNINSRVWSFMRKQFLFETPLGLWLRAEYFCMVSPVKHCCTPIRVLNNKSVEVCCAFTFFPWLLWQMGVSQVHSVCLTFPYLSKNNMQLWFLLCYCSQAGQAFFSNNLYSVSGPTNQLGVCCGHLRANDSPCMDGGSGCGCCWSNLCSCLGQLPGKRYLCLSIQETKNSVLFLDFFSLYLSGTDWEDPKLMHTEPSSFLALPA